MQVPPFPLARPLCGALWLLSLVACGESPRRAPENALGVRHVVLVSIDTLRADRLGCYGFHLEGHDSVSPRLDALAREGVVFERSFSTAPTTLASHTSLMTGTHPSKHGVVRNRYAVHDDNEMLAEVLLQSGFYTSGFIGAAPLDRMMNFAQGFLQYDQGFDLRVGNSPSGFQRRAEQVTDAVLGWLGARYGEGPVEDSLFLFVHYFDVHAPYDAPAPFGGMYQAEGARAPASDRVGLKRVKDQLADMRHGADPDEAFLERARRHAPAAVEAMAGMDLEYAAELTYTDHHLGRLFDELRRRGVYDDALILVTSDHGETLGEHADVLSHGGTVYDSEIHVPLLVRFPGGRHGGARVSRLASGVDLMPTVLEALELEVPAVVQGRSLLAAVEGQAAEAGAREVVFAEATKPWGSKQFDGDELWPNRPKYGGVRTERWKYVERPGDGRERLIDLVADPEEQRNLLLEGRLEDAAVLEDLRARLRAWRRDVEGLRTPQVDSEDQLKALEALGYTGQ